LDPPWKRPPAGGEGEDDELSQFRDQRSPMLWLTHVERHKSEFPLQPSDKAHVDAAQRPGVSCPPPTRSTTVKTDAQLRQLGGSAA
jgi:hypothetical protein